MEKPRDRSNDSPTFSLKRFLERPIDTQIEYTGFTEAHMWGARIVLNKLIVESREGWNSTGFRLWIDTQLTELERLEDDLLR